MYNLLAKGIQMGVKQLTLTASQKTAASIASKVAIGVGTTAVSTAVNYKIQEKQLAKNAAQTVSEAEKIVNGEMAEDDMTTEEEYNKLMRKARTKGTVASGLVIAAGSIGMAAVDQIFKSSKHYN